MTKPLVANKAIKKSEQFQNGKLYLLKSDVWAIDYTHGEFIQVYIRGEVFKIEPENLVLLEEKTDE